MDKRDWLGVFAILLLGITGALLVSALDASYWYKLALVMTHMFEGALIALFVRYRRQHR